MHKYHHRYVYIVQFFNDSIVYINKLSTFYPSPISL